MYTDAAILYCVPESGCDLNYLVERYTCFERVAIPSYEVVAGCLRRAIRAGAMLYPEAGLHRLSDEWFVRAHLRDGEFNSTQAMIEFAEELEKREWPVVWNADFVLSESEYELAVEHTRQFIEQLFARPGR